MKTSKAFLDLENRIKELKMDLNPVDKSILKKISKCSEDEVHNFMKTGTLPAIKLTDKEMKVIKAGWKISFKINGHEYGVKGGADTKYKLVVYGGAQYSEN